MDSKKKKVALSSVFASIALTLLKLVVGIMTGSIGIISEAAHSGLDFAAAFITYLAVRISGRPADITHHYGHGKVESFSALIETGLLVLTSIWIIYEAVHRLMAKSIEIEVTWYAFVVMIISIIVDFSRSRALKKVAVETRSQALEADALHFQSDIYSSLVVIIGLIFVSLGIKGADAIAAIGVAFLVLFASYRLGKRTIDVLIDAAPLGLTERLTEITKKIDGVVGIERLRARPAGSSYFVDIIVNVSRNLPLEQVNKINKLIEQKIQKELQEADIVIHVKPIKLEGETVVERIQAIASNHNVSIHNVSVYSSDNKKYINFDLEAGHNLSLTQAHEISEHLEKSIINELGNNVIINTHLEPVEHEDKKSKIADLKESDEIRNVIIKVKEKVKEISDIHNVSIYEVKNKPQISLHCTFKKKTSLEEAHRLSEQAEDAIREYLPKVENISIHVEPK